MPLMTRRNLFALLAGTAVAAIGTPWWMSRMKVYQGPVSDHFDGLHFFDPEGAPPKSMLDLARWRFTGERAAKWPEHVPNDHADTPPVRVNDGVRLSYVGHVSWL